MQCSFTPSSFDLTVTNLNGKSYRLRRAGLEREIDPSASKLLIKPNKIVLLLRKSDQFSQWTRLTSKSGSSTSHSKIKEDPSAGIMDVMKNLYEEGDDMTKVSRVAHQ